MSELPSLAGRSVFITGANGFVGRKLAERCRGLGAEVMGLDTVAEVERGVVAGDICDPAAWQGLLDGCDVLIHTAAVMTNNVNPAVAWGVNVVGTRRVIEAAADAGVGRFVHLSTMGVGRFAQIQTEAVERFHPDAPLDEHWPLMPTGNPYTDTKIAGSTRCWPPMPRANWPPRSSARPTSTGRAVGPGCSGRWPPFDPADSCCRTTARGCSPPSTSTTWSTASWPQPPPRRPPGTSSIWAARSRSAPPNTSGTSTACWGWTAHPAATPPVLRSPSPRPPGAASSLRANPPSWAGASWRCSTSHGPCPTPRPTSCWAGHRR
ncbi:MAG: NAD(P)-dependent oxidoreductase [Candidatus Microthrix sp.]|nr:NAD(P)-dependent oxidoreductase [Candidatus Microthrix sp.]